MPNEAVRNPYRIDKPKSGVVFRSKFRFATKKGQMLGGTFAGSELRLTELYLWLTAELTIPIPAIETLELVAKDRVLRVAYHNVLKHEVEEAFICVPGFLGSSRKKLALLHERLVSLRQAAPSMGEFFVAEGSEEADVRLGCERCGDPRASLLEMGQFLCVGILPFAGYYSWDPKRRLLCERHARRACAKFCLATAVAGNLGFPGFLVAPFRVWKNVSSLRKAFPDSAGLATALFLVTGVAPLAAVAWLIWSIW